jgi:hypothetical protein
MQANSITEPRKESRTFTPVFVPTRSDPTTARKTQDPLDKRQNYPMRRTIKTGRLSDRWPVLHRLIRARTSASTRSRPSPPNFSSSCEASSDTGNGNKRAVAAEERRCTHHHPSYPKFPSPLSGLGTMKRATLARHNYANRGYSQAAIQAQRELWRKRKYEWDEYEHLLWQAGISLDEAYGGIVETETGVSLPLPPYKVDEARKISTPSITSADEDQTTDSKRHNPAIFPRLGDLSSIRNPFLLSVDTWFSDFPLWTLSKLIWIFDINYRCASSQTTLRTRPSSLDFMEDLSTSDVSTISWATCDSDASDATLVQETATPKFLTPSRIPQSADAVALMSSLSSTDTICAKTIRQEQGWETNWFLRWESLYQQVSLATDMVLSTSGPMSPLQTSKEATRIILTSATILSKHGFGKLEKAGSLPLAAKVDPKEKRVSIPSVILPSEDDEEEDYGDVIPTSKYRMGAHVDPHSMFATANTEYLEYADDPKRDRECESYDAPHSKRSQVDCNDLTERLERMTIY